MLRPATMCPHAPSALLLAYPERLAPVHAARTLDACDRRERADSNQSQTIVRHRSPQDRSRPAASNIVAAQSDCPFQAVARHRLRVDPWPEASAGLSRKERGILLHAAMAAFWTSVRDHATLASLDAAGMRARIAAAVERGLAGTRCHALAHSCRRSFALPKRAASQPCSMPGSRLELARSAFAVVGTEFKTTLELEHLLFRLRIDRVDALDSGRHGHHRLQVREER